MNEQTRATGVAPDPAAAEQLDAWDRLAALAFGGDASADFDAGPGAELIPEIELPQIELPQIELPEIEDAGFECLAVLKVPAARQYVSLARTAAMHVAGILDLSLGRVADLRLAVDEACGQFLRDPAEGDLELRFEATGDALRVKVRGAVPEHWPARGSLGLMLMEAMASEVRWEAADGRGMIALIERLRA